VFIDEVVAFETNDQISVRNETINVLSAQRIESGSMAGTIINGQVVNQ
jgi:hypothetical protein